MKICTAETDCLLRDLGRIPSRMENSNQASFDVTSGDSAISAEFGKQTHSRMFDLPG
jgi:hypothetical protein